MCRHALRKRESSAFVRLRLFAVLVVGNPCEQQTLGTLNGIPGNDSRWADRIEGATCRVRSGEMIARLRPWQCPMFAQNRCKGSGAS